MDTKYLQKKLTKNTNNTNTNTNINTKNTYTNILF